MYTIIYQPDGQRRRRSTARSRAGAGVLLAVLVLIVTRHVLAQDVRSILSPGAGPSGPPMIESIQPLLPPNQPAMPGTVVPPPVTDPYAPVDEVGPYDPGMGWTCGGSCPPSWRGRVEVLDFTRNRAS